MKKVYRGNIDLSMTEYRDIQEVFNSNKEIEITKEIEIEGENQTYSISCLITNYYCDKKVDIIIFAIEKIAKANINTTNNIYHKFSLVIGVHKIAFKDKKGDEINILLNINKPYITKAHKNFLFETKISPLASKMIDGEKEVLENEISYRNFEEEFDLILATYCVLVKPSNFIEEVKEMYLDKLYYVGIDLDDYHIGINKLKVFIKNAVISKNKETIFNAMLYLVSAVVNNDITKYNEGILAECHNLIESYISI